MNRRKMYHPNRVQNFYDQSDGIVVWWVASAFAFIGAIIFTIFGMWVPLGLVAWIPLTLAHYHVRVFNHEAFSLEPGSIQLKVYDQYHTLQEDTRKKLSLSVDSIRKLTEDEARDVLRALKDLKTEENKQRQLEAVMAARGKEIVRSINEVYSDLSNHNASYESTIKEMKKAELL